MAIRQDELDALQEKISKKRDTWGNRDNLFNIGVKMADMRFLETPIVLDQFSEQVSLYFDWIKNAEDRRTRRIVKSQIIEGWQTIDENTDKYEKILEKINEGKIESRTVEIDTLEFKSLVGASKQYPELCTEALELIAQGTTGRQLHYIFVQAGDELKQTFAKTYGTFKKEEFFQVKTSIWKDRFWTVQWAITHGNKYVNGKNSSYLGCNPVYVIGEDQSRSKNRVTELDMLFGELDYYKMDKYKNFTQEQMVELVFEILDQNGFPRPTEILFPRGIQLVWRTNPVGQLKYQYWVFLQRYIYEMLKPVGADAAVVTDSARVLRAIGSIHKATGKVVTLKTYVEPGMRYDFEELLEAFVPKEAAEHRKKLEENRKNGKKKYEAYLKYLEHKEKADAKKVEHLKAKAERNKNKPVLQVLEGEGNQSELQKIINDPWNIRHGRILLDLAAIVEYRQGKVTGCREFICFLTRYYTLCVTAGNKLEALNEMRKIYDSFDDYESDHDYSDFNVMCELTKSAEKGYKKWASKKYNSLGREGYNYSKKRLRELLEIQPEEDVFLKALMSDEEVEKRARERDLKKKTKKNRANGVKSHSEKKQEKIDAITSILKENPTASVREIVTKLSESEVKMSRGTVQNYLKLYFGR